MNPMTNEISDVLKFCPVCGEDIPPSLEGSIRTNNLRWVVGPHWKDCCSKECARFQHLADAMLIAAPVVSEWPR